MYDINFFEIAKRREEYYQFSEWARSENLERIVPQKDLWEMELDLENKIGILEKIVRRFKYGIRNNRRELQWEVNTGEGNKSAIKC
ncbi:hypothetical protein [Pseudobutyrivibrio xylanivorans]|uniref:hypothetical protein n=1 Tax=Pseudobutyrivibrio xylanivorans TaxID=185007 RepID=UPI000934EEF5|nr:hypothetical protein [Pseudobutyrivibrio xylanivorans]